MNPQTTQPAADLPPAHDAVARLLLQTLRDSTGINPVHVIGACVQIAVQFANYRHLQAPVAELLRACAGELDAEARAQQGPLQ